MPLFHFAPVRLAPGSVVQPGNFGRILKRYGINSGCGNSWLLSRELIFEQLRPDGEPSRLNACFALPTQADAQKYQQVNDTNYLQVLHEVELVDPNLPQHQGDISHCDLLGSPPFLDPTRMAAHQYWQGAPGDPAKGTELVTASALRVIRIV